VVWLRDTAFLGATPEFFAVAVYVPKIGFAGKTKRAGKRRLQNFAYNKKTIMQKRKLRSAPLVVPMTVGRLLTGQPEKKR